jgi:hypothetical protein
MNNDTVQLGRFGEDMYAFVPFLDMANHDSNPNADFRLAGRCL